MLSENYEHKEKNNVANKKDEKVIALVAQGRKIEWCPVNSRRGRVAIEKYLHKYSMAKGKIIESRTHLYQFLPDVFS